MRFVAAACFVSLALAGCMPTEQFVANGAGAAVDNPAAAVDPPVVLSAFQPPRHTPKPVARPDFEGVKASTRALGALVKEAQDIDDGKQPATPMMAQTDAPAAPQVVAFAPTSAPPAAPAAVVAAAAPIVQAMNGKGAAASPGYYAAYEDTIVNCFPQSLREALNDIATHFNAPVEVTSGFRDHGRSHSMHRRCMAADIRIAGVSPGALAAYARTAPNLNGVGTYHYTDLTHVDVREDKMAWRY